MTEYITLKDAAMQLGYKTIGAVRQLLMENGVRLIKPGKHYLVDKDDFENYLKKTQV
jgi:excisionase family DNA binding protein